MATPRRIQATAGKSIRGNMAKLKAGTGPYSGSNIGIIKTIFGISVAKNDHGTYHLKGNKWVAFIYLAIQQPDGTWENPIGAAWRNIPDSDGKGFTRICDDPTKNRLFALPNRDYAIFTKDPKTKSSYFYGVFEFEEEKNNYVECVFRRKSPELDLAEWS